MTPRPRPTLVAKYYQVSGRAIPQAFTVDGWAARLIVYRGKVVEVNTTQVDAQQEQVVIDYPPLFDGAGIPMQYNDRLTVRPLANAQGVAALLIVFRYDTERNNPATNQGRPMDRFADAG